MNSIGVEAPPIFVMIWTILTLAFVQAHQGIDVRIVDDCLLLDLGRKFRRSALNISIKKYEMTATAGPYCGFRLSPWLFIVIVL